MRVFLVGPMGSGKSVLGRRLATALGLAFEDSDAWVERRAGASLAWIFEREGEAGFRRRESEAIAELATRDDLVLATGGGAVLDATTRATLRSHGTVVFLAAEPATQHARLGADATRPLLARGSDRAATLAALYAARLPLYREVAHLELATDEREVAELVAELTARLPR